MPVPGVLLPDVPASTPSALRPALRPPVRPVRVPPRRLGAGLRIRLSAGQFRPARRLPAGDGLLHRRVVRRQAWRRPSCCCRSSHGRCQHHPHRRGDPRSGSHPDWSPRSRCTSARSALTAVRFAGSAPAAPRTQSRPSSGTAPCGKACSPDDGYCGAGRAAPGEWTRCLSRPRTGRFCSITRRKPPGQPQVGAKRPERPSSSVRA